MLRLMYFHAEPVLSHCSTSIGYHPVNDEYFVHSFISVCCCNRGNDDRFSPVAILFARFKEVSYFVLVFGFFVCKWYRLLGRILDKCCHEHCIYYVFHIIIGREIKI